MLINEFKVIFYTDQVKDEKYTIISVNQHFSGIGFMRAEFQKPSVRYRSRTVRYHMVESFAGQADPDKPSGDRGWHGY